MDVDVLVIGAGAGGLLTAARLAHLGYRTLVVERLDNVGGRASTDDVDGFKVNNGAIVIETGGITEQTFAEVGAAVRHPRARAADPVPDRRQGRRRHRRRLGLPAVPAHPPGRPGCWPVSAEARRDEGLPDDELSTADWVSRYTKNESVHGIFRNMCGSVFAVGSDELPARVFLTYFTRKSAFKTFGFCPRGHHRHLGVAGRRDHRGAAARSGWPARSRADHGGRPGHRRRHRPGRPRRQRAEVAARW